MGVRTGLAALVALPVVAVLTVDPGGASPFGPARWWLVSTLAAGGAGLVVCHGRTRLHRPTLRLWWVLLAMLALGAVTDDDVRVALLGHPVRHLGLVTWFLLALLFAAGQQLSADVERRRLSLGALVALSGITLWCGWELAFGRPIRLATFTQRLLGPFGSAAMLGAACCLLVPMAVAVAVSRSERRSIRLGAAVAGVGGLVALVGSGSRAALVGAAIATVAIAFVRRPSRATVVAITSAALVALAVLAPRLGDVLDRAEGSGSRLDEWALGLDVLADDPIAGVGPDGYRIAVMGHVDADYERTYGRDFVLPDRAHSGPLDVALQGGVLAGLVYVVLVGWVVVSALRRARRGDALAVGIACGLTAYAAQQLLLFPLAEFDPVFWLFAGTMIGGSSTVTAPTETRTRSRVAIGALALIASSALFVAGLLGVAADRLARTAIMVHTIDDALRDVDRAIALRPDDLTYRSLAVRVHLERGTLADVDEAHRQADAALRWSPNDPIALDDHASVLLRRAEVTGADDDARAAVAAWRSLVERDPTRARWQVEYGRAAALAGEVDLARNAWTVAAELRPDDPVPARLLDGLGGA